MVDIKLSPPREGVRGGREQFKWEDLKSHDLKDRERYLGHSVKVGLLQRKNKFYKHDWYLKKDSETSDKDIDEVELTRRYEEEMMQEMLGVKPKRLMLLKSKPTDPRQLKELLDYNKDSKHTEYLDSKSRSNSNTNLYQRSKSKSRTRSLSSSRSSSDDSYRRQIRGYRDKDNRRDKYKYRKIRSNIHSKREHYFKSDEKYDRESDRKKDRYHNISKISRSRRSSRSHERAHRSIHRHSHHSSRYRD